MYAFILPLDLLVPNQDMNYLFYYIHSQGIQQTLPSKIASFSIAKLWNLTHVN